MPKLGEFPFEILIRDMLMGFDKDRGTVVEEGDRDIRDGKFNAFGMEETNDVKRMCVTS